jgi:hypothetical protein
MSQPTPDRTASLRYGYPRLGRYGLTHGLLAWARCVVWCEASGAAMIAPFWLKLRVGPYLRRERDKRSYFRLFHAGGAIAGARRLALLARRPRLPVGEGWPPAEVPARTLVVFDNALADNERKSFAQVLGHGPMLRRRLLAMTRAKFRPAPAPAAHIAIHVRLGDFTAPPADGRGPAKNVRLPLAWYGERLVALRDALGVALPAVVYSDGSDEELAPLLNLPAVSRPPRAESVTDLLAIGQAACLIGSGSGFSLWGAFLGSAPRLSHPGQRIVPIYQGAEAHADIESGLGEPLPESFASAVRARLAGPPR